MVVLELVHKPKYQNCFESDFPCAQDPSIPVCYTGLWLIEAYLQSLKSVVPCVRTQSWLLQTDGRTQLICLRISRWTRVADQYFFALHTYWQNYYTLYEEGMKMLNLYKKKQHVCIAISSTAYTTVDCITVDTHFHWKKGYTNS